MKNEESKKGMVYVIIAAIVIIVGAIACFKFKANTKNADISQSLMTEVIKSQAEPVTARIDITTPLVDADKPQFEVYVDGSDTPEKQAKWMAKYKIQGNAIQKKGTDIKIAIKVLNDNKLNIDLRGPWDKNKVKHRVEYTSVIVNNKEVLSKPIATWHDKPFTYSLNAKKGNGFLIIVKWKKYNKE